MDLLYNIPNPMTGSPKTLVNVNKILCVTQAYLGMASGHDKLSAIAFQHERENSKILGRHFIIIQQIMITTMFQNLMILCML